MDLAGSAQSDTGQTRCTDEVGLMVACAGSGQDAEFGLDRTAAAPGDGAAGFRFLKVCHSGHVAGKGICPGNPVFGPALTEWGCTADRNTGLLWELKTADFGPRDMNLYYSNLGNGAPTDSSSLVSHARRNLLCGASDWRLPTRAELQSIVHYGRTFAPFIDAEWFPNTGDWSYWTGTVGIPSSNAWAVAFQYGFVQQEVRANGMHARLVRRFQ